MAMPRHGAVTRYMLDHATIQISETGVARLAQSN